ncbi:MAG: hypothetical protein KDE33_04595 [Bacteroidetes bacterium]|nr:hypothetical protein [Bacteroidota bacterium]
MADCGLLSCQTATLFERATNLEIYHTACHYLYKMLAAGVHLLAIEYQSFTIISHLNRSTDVLEKNSFRAGKKSDGKQTSSIAIFGWSVGSCELQLCLAVWVG